MSTSELKSALVKLGMDADEAEKRVAEEARYSEALLKQMSPKGALGLPSLLEDKRLTHGIPDAAFGVQATYDRVYLWQIPQMEDNYGDTLIAMPDQAKTRERKEAPMGIIIGAGLEALDILRSHGMGLGHTVWFVRLAPWKIRCCWVAGHAEHVLVMFASEIAGSVETATSLRERKARVVFRDGHHMFCDEEGHAIAPIHPRDPED